MICSRRARRSDSLRSWPAHSAASGETIATVPCRSARPAEVDARYSSSILIPKPTAVTRLVDHRTIGHSMDEAIADPACEFARIETVGDAQFRLKVRIDICREETTLVVELSAGAWAAGGQCPGGRDAPLIPISVVLLRARRNGLLGRLRRPAVFDPGLRIWGS